MNSLVLRKALLSDLGVLVSLSRRTINAIYRSFLGDVAVDAFLESGAADRYIEENIGRCSVVVVDAEVVGYAVSRDNMIDLLMIDQAVHRRGFGSVLLAHVEATLFQKYDEATLESFEGNRTANAFYRRNGWLEVGKHFDMASGVNKITFHKSA